MSHAQLKWLIGILAVLFFATPVLAQETSADDRERTEAETKALRDQYRSESTAEKIVNLPLRIVYAPLKYTLIGIGEATGYVYDKKLVQKTTEILSWDQGRQGIRPTYNARTGKEWLYQGVGIKYFHKDILNPGSRLTVVGTVDPVDHDWYEVHLADVNLASNRLMADFTAGTIDMEDEEFYGFGMDIDPDVEIDYQNQMFWTQAGFGSRLSESIAMTLQAGFERNDFKNVIDEDDLEELSPDERALYDYIELIADKIDLVSGQLELIYDSRNHPGLTLTGSQFLARGSVYNQVDDDVYGFTKITADYTRYLHLFQQRVLVFRVAGETTEPLSADRHIPFYYLSDMGRWVAVRGFEQGRFRERDMVLASLEYRYPILPLGLDFLWFVDTGQVATDLAHDFDFDALETTFGAGIRSYNENGEGLRLEVAKTRDGFRASFGLNRTL